MRGICVARTAAAISDATARVLSSAVGHRWGYVLNVVIADAWPTPASSRSWPNASMRLNG